MGDGAAEKKRKKRPDIATSVCAVIAAFALAIPAAVIEKHRLSESCSTACILALFAGFVPIAGFAMAAFQTASYED